MKDARKVIFILLAIGMVLLSVGLIIAKRKEDKGKNVSGKNGREVFTEEVTSLVFEAGACNIEVVTGEEDAVAVAYEGLKYGTLSHRLENGELKISYKQNDGWTAKLFQNGDFNDQRIILTVPEDVVLNSAVFEFGAANIEMDGITAEKLYITVGAGELNASGLTATELAKLNVGAGAFYAEQVKLVNATLECGVGEMEIAGEITGESTVDCGVGAMELRLDGEEEAYYGELNCGLGELRFGAIQIGGSGKQSYGTSSAESRMDIKCGIGEVDVQFYK